MAAYFAMSIDVIDVDCRDRPGHVRFPHCSAIGSASSDTARWRDGWWRLDFSGRTSRELEYVFGRRRAGGVIGQTPRCDDAAERLSFNRDVEIACPQPADV